MSLLPASHASAPPRGPPRLRQPPWRSLASGYVLRRALRRVAVVGGTHGNELSGVELVKRWLRRPEFESFESLEVQCHLGNEQAIDVCRRFIDSDLNRCFSRSKLAQRLENYEARRARELNELLGPRFSEKAVDLCIDLHNTTSNFGCGIIITNASTADLHWKLQLCAALTRSCPDVRVLFDCLGDPSEEPFLPLVAKNDLTYELGPMAHGTLTAEVFWNHRRLVLQTLDFLHRYNCQELSEQETSPKALEVYVSKGAVRYPRASDGTRCAVIAESLQGHDFELLRSGEPVFQHLETQETIRWEGPDCYPAFVNEAAYLAAGVAFQKTQRLRVEVPELRQDGSLSAIQLPSL